MSDRLSFPILLALAATSLIAAPACVADDEPPVDQTEADIIDGSPAPSASLDAIGTLAYIRSGADNTSCTGFLVAPDVVLTVKSCFSELPPAKIFFVVGKATNLEPRRIFKVASKVAAAGDVDAVAFHLQAPVTGVTPVRLALLSTIKVGKRLQVTGFGTDEHGGFAVRRTGPMTLLGSQGKRFELLFGSFQGFLDDGAPVLFPDLDPDDAADRATLRAQFDGSGLAPGEAWLGGRDGDISVCDGDNGAPATTKVGGKLTAVALAAHKLGQCQFGGGFTAVTAKVIDFVARETR
jgi:Trypsin